MTDASRSWECKRKTKEHTNEHWWLHRHFVCNYRRLAVHKIMLTQSTHQCVLTSMDIYQGVSWRLHHEGLPFHCSKLKEVQFLACWIPEYKSQILIVSLKVQVLLNMARRR